MKIWLLIWAHRDEWNNPGVTVFTTEKEARTQFINVVKEQLEYVDESTLLAVVDAAEEPIKFEILKTWVQEVETEWELFIDEVELPEPGWYVPTDQLTDDPRPRVGGESERGEIQELSQ